VLDRDRGVRAARQPRIGELSTFAWASLIGFGIAVVPAVIAILSSTPSQRTLVMLALGGVFNVAGLVARFSALRRGPVSLVVPISSTEGAIAAMLAAATGSHLPPGGWAALAILLSGVLITAVSQWSTESSGAQLKPIGLAVIAALCFGTGLFLPGPRRPARRARARRRTALADGHATGRAADGVQKPLGLPAWLERLAGRSRDRGDPRVRLLHRRCPSLGPDRRSPLCPVRDPVGA
jgi:uncharacterized membrane protein